MNSNFEEYKKVVQDKMKKIKKRIVISAVAMVSTLVFFIIFMELWFNCDTFDFPVLMPVIGIIFYICLGYLLYNIYTYVRQKHLLDAAEAMSYMQQPNYNNQPNIYNQYNASGNTKYCPNCGSMIDNSANFCKNCGCKIG